MFKISFLLFVLFTSRIFAANEVDNKKNHVEDIFIWKISDELKLSTQEEKQFTDIQKNLNKQKFELNKKIQDSIQSIQNTDQDKNKLTDILKEHRKLITQYNQISLDEFDQIKKLFGATKFAKYIQIKSELNTKIKSILIGEKEKKEEVKLPPPKVIIEKNE